MRVVLSAFVFLLVGFGSVGLAVPAWAGDGLVALQSADPSCPDDSGNIYVDCNNGTVTDNRTGLVWLKNADCLRTAMDWNTAMGFVAGLADMPAFSAASFTDCGLSDGSSPGEWRLASVAEWEAMVKEAVALGCVNTSFGGPAITNDAGNDCWQEGPASSFEDVQISPGYWSATTHHDPGTMESAGGTNAWVMGMSFGNANFPPKSDARSVWPVRGGQ
jgi:hypothetical protein